MRRTTLISILITIALSGFAFPQRTDEVLDSIDAMLNKVADNKPYISSEECERHILALPVDSLDSHSANALMRSGCQHHNTGEDALAVADWHDALEQLAPTDSYFSYIARCISDYYADRPDKDEEQLYYLALAAYSDVTNGVGHSPALAKTGQILLQRGERYRGRAYILHATYTDTDDKDLRADDTDITVAMSALYDESSYQHVTHHVIFLIILSILIALLFFLSYKYIRLIREETRNHASILKLEANNEAQATVIKQIISLNERYIDANDDFVRLTSRKIKTGQAQDLFKTIESGKLQADRIERFNGEFDEMFYLLFPDFKQQINALFQFDKQIELPNGPQLNAELRILAFLRLGIEDPAKLSKFLGLSVNTIYTYRNRAKSRAIDRDNFEQSVRNIGIKC